MGIANIGTDVGFNFAVPVHIMKRAIPTLIKEGECIHLIVSITIVALTAEVISSENIVKVDPYKIRLLITDVTSNPQRMMLD